MSKGVQSGLELIGAAVALYYGNYQLAASLAAAAFSTERAARSEIAARNAYNASLRDRYAMIRSATTARQLVFGRCRVSGPMFFGASYGADNEHLTFCVALAAHELDAIETVYFDDKPVTLDGAGNVIGVQERDSFSIVTSSATVTIQKKPTAGTVTATARYGDVVVPLTVSGVSGVNVTVTGATSGQVGQLDVFYQPNPDPYAPKGVTQRQSTYTVATSTQTFTLPSGVLSPPPDATGVHVVYQITSSVSDDASAISGATVVGYNVTLTGLTVGRNITIYYQTSNGATKARVRKYLGAPGQTADSGMITNFPGTWTSNHKATGIAYLVVELDYDQDAFTGGIPSVSAIVRGMKCFDPRTSTTAWTENPALHARALATHSLAGNLPTNCIDDPACIIAANICDTSTTYTVGGVNYVRPLYTSGYAFSVDRKPMDGITDLCQAMGGGWVWSDGALRLNAGGFRTANPGVLDETWLTDEDAVQIQVGYQRTALVNTITGTFSDKFQDYTPVPMPRLSPPAYTTADGATLSQSIQYSAVTFAGQAQYISSCLLRRQRQGMVVKMRCNFRAWQDQTFDVRNVSLARFGWVNKPFEVIKDTQTADGSFELILQETAAAIWDMDAGFTAADIAPNTNMPVPWGLPLITSLAATTGDATLLRQADGTVIPQVLVTWDAITDSRVLQGGYVEIRYWRMGDLADTFQTFRAQGGDSQAFLSGVRSGSMYIVTARTVSVITQGPWCNQVVTNASGKTIGPANVTGAAYSQGGGRVHLSWDASPDLDYKLTEIRVGASWAAGTKIASAAATSFDWPQTATATYTLWFAHQNWSGFYSTTPASLSVAVDASALAVYPSTLNLAIGLVSASAIVTPQTVQANAGVRLGADGFVYKRQGNASSVYVSTGLHFDLAGTFTGTYYVQFDLLTSTTTSGSPIISGTGQRYQVSPSGASSAVAMTATNAVGDATFVATIYDSTGAHQLASFNVSLHVESTP